MKQTLLLILITIGSICAVVLHFILKSKSRQVDQALLVLWDPLEDVASGENFFHTHGTLNMASLLEAKRQADNFHLHLKGVGVQIINPVITKVFRDSSVGHQEALRAKEKSYKKALEVTRIKLKKYVDSMRKLSKETMLRSESFSMQVETPKGEISFFYDRDSAKLDFSHAKALLQQLDSITRKEGKVIIHDRLYDNPTYIELGFIHSYMQLKCRKLEQRMTGEIGKGHQEIFNRKSKAYDIQFNNIK
jgi:hypothetical protein